MFHAIWSSDKLIKHLTVVLECLSQKEAKLKDKHLIIKIQWFYLWLILCVLEKETKSSGQFSLKKSKFFVHQPSQVTINWALGGLIRHMEQSWEGLAQLGFSE